MLSGSKGTTVYCIWEENNPSLKVTTIRKVQYSLYYVTMIYKFNFMWAKNEIAPIFLSFCVKFTY